MKASSTKLALTSKRRDKYFILINGDVGIVDMMHEEGDITCRIVGDIQGDIHEPL